MGAKENKIKYIEEYKRQNIKRVPLDMQNEMYAAVLQAAAEAGESVNGYIKSAIIQRMKKEGQA